MEKSFDTGNLFLKPKTSLNVAIPMNAMRGR